MSLELPMRLPGRLFVAVIYQNFQATTFVNMVFLNTFIQHVVSLMLLKLYEIIKTEQSTYMEGTQAIEIQN